MCDPEDVEALNSEITAVLPDFNKYAECNTPFWKRVNALVKECMFHDCNKNNGACKAATGVCDRGYPEPVTLKAFLCAVLDRWRYPRRTLSDQFIVNYHPGLLYVWGAHCHLQRASQTVWIKYLMKYLVKVDTHGKCNLTVDNKAAFGLPEEVSAGVVNAAAACVHARIITTPEAAWQLQKLDFVIHPGTHKFVNVTLKAPAALYFKRAMQRADATSMADKYFNRPAELLALNIVEYFSKYEVHTAKSANKLGKDRKKLTDKNGMSVVEVVSPTVPIVSIYYPQVGENFWYTELFLKTPAISHHELLNPTVDGVLKVNKSKSWQEAAVLHKLWAALQSYITGTRKFQWEDYHTKNAVSYIESTGPIQATTTMIEDPETNVEGNDVLHTLMPKPLAAINTFFKAAIQRQYAPAPRDQQASDRDHASVLRSPDQASAMAAITAAAKDKALPRLYRIQGPGGTGKSFFIKTLIGVMTLMNMKVIVCASTAKAAYVIGNNATTSHSAFGFTGSDYDYLTSTPLAIYIKLGDVIFIDEVGMMQAGMLQKIHERRLECCDDHTRAHLPFAGKLVILTGDIHQLPAVCKKCQDVHACPHQSTKWLMWSRFQVSTFTTNHRQSNPSQAPFVQLLNFLRLNKPTAEQLASDQFQMLHDRILPVGQAPNFGPDDVIIAPTNELVDSYNTTLVHKFYDPSVIVTLLAKDTYEKMYLLSSTDQAKLKNG